jgi:alpha-tubulin suppressor-like RCC1 family protein
LAFAAVSAATWHSCGVTVDQTAYCWGSDRLEDGYLGSDTYQICTATDNPFRCNSGPVAVAGGHDFAIISAGRWHTCGLTTDGAAYCWGWNGEGQLGDGTTTKRGTPVAVSGGLTFTSLAAGTYQTCGITEAGAAYCWGSWEEEADAQPTPARVGDDLTFESISVAGHACAVATDGTLYCWGPNDWGQLGDGTTVDRATPVRVAGQM